MRYIILQTILNAAIFMKPLFLFLFSVLLSTTMMAQKTVYDANAEPRNVSSFHAVHISNAFDVYITQGSDERVAVSAANKADLGNIETKVENGVLKIRYNEGKKWWGGNKKLKAYIAVKNIDDLRASGACDIKIEGSLHAASLRLNLSGATDLSGELDVEGDLNANLSGASDMDITGSANNVTIDANGASDVKAYNFTTNTCTVDASGASGIRITVDKELSATLSGASSVSYKGGALIRNIKTSGASSISRKS
jgi:hypothetical protein